MIAPQRAKTISAEPKEYVRVACELALESGRLVPGATVCDFECRSPELLDYLSEHCDTALYTCFHNEAAAAIPPSAPGSPVHVRRGSAYDPDLLDDASVDISFLVGALGVSENFEPLLANAIKWTRPGGRVYVFSSFNPFPVDCWVKSRVVDALPGMREEVTWNIFSRTSVSTFLDASLGAGKHRYIPFELPFDVPRNDTDPTRSWTFRDAAGRRLFTNGLSQLISRDFLEIAP